MEISKFKRKMIWSAAAVLWPLLIWAVYISSEPIILAPQSDIVAFLLLMCLVAFFPIIVNETPVFFIQGISMAVFLYFGLFIELILTQVAVIALLFKLRLPKSEVYRIPVNLLMFQLVSVAGGIVYELVGGHHGAFMIMNIQQLFPVILYAFTVFLVNQLLLVLVQSFLQNRKRKFFSKDLVWEGVTSLLVFPVGLVLYILYTQLGTIAILYVGIPFVSLSLVVKLYYSSQKLNVYLQKASDIGHQLTKHMDVNDVLDLFVEKITDMLPVDFAYIIDVDETKTMHLLRYSECGVDQKIETQHFRSNEGITNRIMRTAQPLLFGSRTEWRYLSKGFLPMEAESVLAVPIQRSSQIVGIIILASKSKRTYEKYQLTIVDILASYVGVALENARNYEETKAKSEKCLLTNLYNYRFMEELLEHHFEKMKQGELKKLSLIMIDLDHFKAVNDTYGHQSGNEILVEVASRLKEIISASGTVIRYGGEEFVVVLPGFDRNQSYAVAEMIRNGIANRSFILKQNMNEHSRKKLMVRITASIGVATAPCDADEPLALIRHADRAMYTGAKQKGRNKVAVYSS